MKIITVAAIKGGTGKTTTAAALSQAARYKNKKVLAIDLDPQANLTFCLGADQNAAGIYEVLHGEPLNIQTNDSGIDILSGNLNLSAEKTKAASITRLQAALAQLPKKYDYIFIDTPPQMGEVTFNALQASTDVIIPLLADSFSLQGLYQIMDIIRQIQRHNTKLKVLGTVITQYDRRPNICRVFKSVIADKGKEEGAPLLQTIRKSVVIEEAQGIQASLFDYAPRSKPAQDYLSLYTTISKRR